MKYELYIAYDNYDIPRYVGIGKPGRHRHVNSGKSHSFVLNAVVDVHGPLKIDVQILECSDNEQTILTAKEWERNQIAKFGRLQLGTGSLLNRSEGGEECSWCADTKWFTSPGGESKRFSKIEEVPFGWVAGRNTKGSDFKRGTFPIRTGWKAWHNPKTGEILQLSPNDQIPNGFLPGTGKNTVKSKKWFHNPKTGECKRCEPGNEPHGFIKGRK